LAFFYRFSGWDFSFFYVALQYFFSRLWRVNWFLFLRSKKRAFSRFLSVLQVRFIDFCNLLFQSVFGLFFGFLSFLFWAFFYPFPQAK